MHSRLLKLIAAAILSLMPLHAAAQSLEERVVELRLDNGLLFLLVAQPDRAPTFSGTIMVKVGGVDEPLGQTGLAHMFEHMAFKGTPWIGTTDYESELAILERIDSVAVAYTAALATISMDDREILGALERRAKESLGAESVQAGPAQAAWDVARALADTLAEGPDGYPSLETYVRVKELMARHQDLSGEHRRYAVKDELTQFVKTNGGVGMNAGTSKDYTVYYEEFPANRLELWAMLESQRFMYPVMREFYSERDVVVEERRMRTDDDPEGKLYENFMAASMIAHPYGRPTIGWRSDIEQATAENAAAFRELYYVPENAVGVLVGNFDVDETTALIERYFSRIPAATQPVPMIQTVEPAQAGERRVQVEFDAEPMVMIGFHKPNYPHPDSYVFSVIANILRDAGNSSRFYRELVNAGIAGSVSVYEELPGQRYDNLFMIQASPIAPHTTAEVEAEIYRILGELATEAAPELEIQKAKNQIEARFIRGLTSNAHLGRELAHRQAIGGDWRLLVTHSDIVSEVTAEDIQRVAARYFQQTNRTVATLARPDAQ